MRILKVLSKGRSRRWEKNLRLSLRNIFSFAFLHSRSICWSTANGGRGRSRTSSWRFESRPRTSTRRSPRWLPSASLKLFFKASPQRRVPISVSLRLFFLLTTDQLLVRFFISFASILDTTLGLHSCLLVGGSLVVRAVVWGAPKYIFYLLVMEVVGKTENQLIWSRITGNKKLTLAVSKVIEGLIERSLCLRIMPVHWPDRAKNFFTMPHTCTPIDGMASNNIIYLLLYGDAR